MDRILVGTDGSVGGRTAVRWAIEAARASGAELIVAAAWKPRLAKVSPQEYEQLRRDAQGVLDDDGPKPLAAPILPVGRCSWRAMREKSFSVPPNMKTLIFWSLARVVLAVTSTRGIWEA